MAHADVSAGHRGYLETLSKINRHFVMPYAAKFVSSAIANCVTCLNRRQKPKHDHMIEFSPMAGEVLAEIAIDTIGPLNENEYNGILCKHILIIVDSYTRFTWLYAIEDVKAETIINCLKEKIFSVHGVCDRIRSDNAASFKSKIFKEVCSRLGIEQVFIPVRSAQSNYSERYNKSVYNFLKTDRRFQEGDWAHKLKAAQFCMNTSFNRRLGCSPYFKFYCRLPKLPIDQFDPLTRTKIKSMNFSELLDCLEKTWKTGQRRTERYLQVENKVRASKAIRLNSYCYIFYDVTQVGVSKKLCSLWVGPCLISRVISDSLFEVQPLQQCRLKDKGVRIVPRDKIYVIDSTLDLTPDEKIDLVVTDDFFGVDSHVAVNFDFPNTIRNLSCSGGIEESENSGSEQESEEFLRVESTTKKPVSREVISFDNSSLGSGVPFLHRNNKDLAMEELSESMSNCTLSEQNNTKANDNSMDLSLSEADKDSTLSSISKDSVFTEERLNDSNLSDKTELSNTSDISADNDDINMDTANDMESRMSILEDTFSKVQEKITNLEHRRASVKRGRDMENDELDRPTDNVKSQKMSDTFHARGRPKGLTNDVLQKRLEEDRIKRDIDRKERFSVKDVVTRKVTNLFSKDKDQEKEKDKEDDNMED